MKFFKYADYGMRVNNVFSKLCSELKIILPMARIEHIGSSSVEGAISKGDLDIFVGVSKDEFNDSLDKIKSIGFTEKLDTFRADYLCMLVCDRYDLDMAIQLVENGSETENFIHFRERLRNDPGLLSEYNDLKTLSAGLSEIEYRSRKAIFIAQVLESG